MDQSSFSGRPASDKGATMPRILIIGFGMTALGFIEKLFSYDTEDAEGPKYAVTVVGEEPWIAYNRVGLTQYFSHRSVEQLYLQPPSWYSSHLTNRLTHVTGDEVTKVDTTSQRAWTKNGLELHYDICIFATGSRAAVPSYTSPADIERTRGVFVYRTVEDLTRMMEYAENAHVKRVSVIGGGLLGLEAAKAATELESISNVTIVERNKWVLSRQLDQEGGRIVLEHVKAFGIDILLETQVKSLIFSEEEVPSLTGLQIHDGTTYSCEMVVFATGIIPRDDLAKACGIEVHPRGGIIVADDLATSAPNVYALGECAAWSGNTYGLIAPCIEMADVLAFNLTEGPTHKMRVMTTPDLSTKLKLVGVNVASFGDYFADQKPPGQVATKHGKHKKATAAYSLPLRSLTYHDPFGSVYKKYIFTNDGKYVVGGMMVGDVNDYTKLHTLVQKRRPLEVPPGQLILGVPGKEGEFDGDDLDDDAQICSCYNVSKGAIAKCVKDGCDSFGDVKAMTKVATGCGGCAPLATSIFNSEMKKAGHAIMNHVCPHFKKSRQDVFMITKIKKLKTFAEVMAEAGENSMSIGCEVCKPAIASILSSLHNEFVMAPSHHQNQDTNDKYLANIQRNGTYSVVPRIPAGEITPVKLKAIAVVAEKYGLYTKITGGQRIDLFGANKQDLPDIWEELINAGFESGHAYGKALRTVKSCVGTSWCRYGIGDSVGLAVELEERYKGIRAPHKIKGGVSGCVRECAEAQSKDFGVIATSKGWNVYVGGNGGAKPRHAQLLAVDVSRSKAVRYIDRFLMLYIQSADRLQRTARWVESLDESGKNGMEYLKKIIIDDSLGICKELDEAMDALVGTYYDEWAEVVSTAERRALFRQFINTEETKKGIELIEERNQQRPADWPEEATSLKFDIQDIPKDDWQWRMVAKASDLRPSSEGSTSAVVNYSDTQIAIFRLHNGDLYATQQMCPHRRAFVLADGLLGDTPDGKPYVSCPLHKRNFALQDGECMTDDNYKIMTFEVKEENGGLLVKLPQPAAIDSVLGTSKWMIKQAKKLVQQHGAKHVEIVGPSEDVANASKTMSDATSGSCGGTTCGNKELEW
ncbi:unnamed protein product [Cyclocybe aegerita]|uniref:Rieske domain-containing protein n=1 Tax=Cyclocybe aegerita TaxID=1973307 RepID=A0A8S0WEK4_CYCAE|nr:unnamed protein product [Cyclocybe aegerita]